MSQSKNEKIKSTNIDENLMNTILTSEQKINTSIYKIDENIKTEQELLDEIKEKIKKKPSLQCIEIDKYNFKGFLFSYETTPDWVNLIKELLPNKINKNESDKNKDKNNKEKDNENESDENEDKNNKENDDGKFKLTNSNISYILVKTILVEDKDKEVKEKITPLKMNMYAIIGGLGYTIISEFIEKNFGLNLVPRLIKTEDNVIRKVVEDRLMGNRIYTSRRNRSNTNLDFETDFSNVYRELEFSAAEDILLKLGVIDSNKNKVNKNVVSKDSFKVSTSLNIGELNTLIERLDEIGREDAKFPLNYFTPANKKGFKDSDIKKLFCSLIYKSLTEDNPEDEEDFNFEIIGQNIADYPMNSKFEIQSETLPIDPIEEPIKMEMIIGELDDEDLSEEFIEELFYKSYLITYDEDSNETQNIELINCLDGFLKDENEEVFYLRNGTWYVYDETYENIAKEQYEQIYDESYDYVLGHILNKFPEFKNKWDAFKEEHEREPGETEYNKLFIESDNVVYANEVPKGEVEIADLILYDDIEDILYLFCLKDKFGARGCRDLYGQIESSSLLIQNEFNNINGNKLREYFEELEEVNENTLNQDEFESYFRSKICYVAGFLKTLRKNTNTPYGKILTHEINKKIKNKGYDFILMNFNFDKYDNESDKNLLN